ncbi:MAG: nucleotide-binding universal stress UspA family protein [Bacteroidia bacterium]|jgi:nucleotide-binding universal stress UspA family protein
MSVPFPFTTVATAIAFSPYTEANLHESARIADMLNANLVLIHVGAETSQKLERLELFVSQTEIERSKVKIEFREGDPVSSILNSCAENNVSLLIAGAMKKENLLKFYTGSIARKLCRKVKCSILLLTDRSVIRNQCREIVVSGDNHKKTKDTIRTANYFGKLLSAKHLTIVDEIDPKTSGDHADDDAQLEATAKKRKELKCKEDERIMAIEKELEKDGSLAVNHKCIFGKAGYTIGHYAAANKADLLVMNSPDSKLGIIDRVFTHDLEYVLSDLPCCLMIVNRNVNSVV